MEGGLCALTDRSAVGELPSWGLEGAAESGTRNQAR